MVHFLKQHPVINHQVNDNMENTQSASLEVSYPRNNFNQTRHTSSKAIGNMGLPTRKKALDISLCIIDWVNLLPVDDQPFLLAEWPC